ncbi:hypothetical protein ACV3UL_15440 [Clostridium perfringens]
MDIERINKAYARTLSGCGSDYHMLKDLELMQRYKLSKEITVDCVPYSLNKIINDNYLKIATYELTQKGLIESLISDGVNVGDAEQISVYVMEYVRRSLRDFDSYPIVNSQFFAHYPKRNITEDSVDEEKVDAIQENGPISSKIRKCVNVSICNFIVFSFFTVIGAEKLATIWFIIVFGWIANTTNDLKKLNDIEIENKVNREVIKDLIRDKQILAGDYKLRRLDKLRDMGLEE